MVIKVKYHTDIDPIEFKENSDWIDLRAAETIEMKKGEFRVISLGISAELPEGYEANIVPRSSTYKNFKIIQCNHFGVIDNSYSGNEDVWGFGAIALEDTIINKNDRICQFRLNKTMRYSFDNIYIAEVDELDGENRGGFGSSGIV